MNHASIILFSIVASCLAGCGSTPEKKALDARELLQHARVNVKPPQTPVVLSLRTKAQVIANTVISSVAGSVAGSSGSASNVNQMQNNMKIGQEFGQQLGQALPDSAAIQSGAGADLALAKKLDEFFSARNAELQDASQNVDLQVVGMLWELGYVSFWTSQDYSLKYRFLFRMTADGTHAAPVAVSCVGEADQVMPLEAWQKETYRALNGAAEKIVDLCSRKFLNEAGLVSQGIAVKAPK